MTLMLFWSTGLTKDRKVFVSCVFLNEFNAIALAICDIYQP